VFASIFEVAKLRQEVANPIQALFCCLEKVLTTKQEVAKKVATWRPPSGLLQGFSHSFHLPHPHVSNLYVFTGIGKEDTDHSQERTLDTLQQSHEQTKTHQ
jgi:hypothetical protein